MPETHYPVPITALAFDFGLKRIGVAVGETITKTAKPIGILTTVNAYPDYTAIEKIIINWRPKVLVVGLPYNEDGSIQELTTLAQNFANTLTEKYATKYKVQVVMVDERYSSIEAKRIFAELRKNKLIKQGEKIDHIAACVILERWLQNI